MNAISSRLNGMTRELWSRWQVTRESWRDARADEFDRRYMQELVSSVDKTVAVVEQLDKLLERIRRDCE
jgi:hypothetical protein